MNKSPLDETVSNIILPKIDDDILTISKGKIIAAHDNDDWIFPFVPHYLAWRNKKYNTNYQFEDIVEYDFWKIFGSSKEQEMSDVYYFHQTYEATTIRPSNDAIAILRHLQRDKNIVITSRDSDLKNITRSHILIYLSDFFKQNSSIILTNNFSPKGESLSKGTVAKNSGVTLAFDDAPKHVLDYVSNNIICFMPDKPWNRTFEVPKNAYRFKNSREAIVILDYLRNVN